MIEKARKENPDMEFISFDASKDFEKLEDKFDIVFQMLVFSGCRIIKKLLADMMNALNPNGVLAVQVPITVEQDMHRVIKNVTGASKWKEKLYGSRVFTHWLIMSILIFCLIFQNDFRIWKTIYCHPYAKYAEAFWNGILQRD